MVELADTLKSIFKEAAPPLCEEAAALIEKCKKDESPFLQDLGGQTQKAVDDLAAGKIDAELFRDLMEDATSLQKIEEAKLSVQKKVRIQKTVLALKKLVVEGLSKMNA